MIVAATPALALAVAVLAATDVPFPVELSALVLVAGILRWLIRREDRVDGETLDRIAALEVETERLRSMESEQRSAKHALGNELAAIRTTLELVVVVADRCTCGALDPVRPVLARLGKRKPT